MVLQYTRTQLVGNQSIMSSIEHLHFSSAHKFTPPLILSVADSDHPCKVNNKFVTKHLPDLQHYNYKNTSH